VEAIAKGAEEFTQPERAVDGVEADLIGVNSPAVPIS
jgi:hypothetical protein